LKTLKEIEFHFIAKTKNTTKLRPILITAIPDYALDIKSNNGNDNFKRIIFSYN
jgi:hypothetical protein